MAQSDACSDIGRWVAEFRLDDAPTHIVDIGRRALIDVLGVTVGGTATEIAKSARSFVACEHGPGECSVIGHDEAPSTPTGAAFANGVAAHSLDFDDTCYAGITHGSAVVAPAALAAAEAAATDGNTLLAAFIAGSEAVYALGKAFGNDLYFRGWWSTTVLGTLGAAMGAARGLGLGAADATTALALAAGHTAGVHSCFGSDAKPLSSGWAAADGLRAAHFSRLGINANTTILDGRLGVAGLFNDGRFDRTPIGALGRTWSLETPGIAFKPYPCCSAAHAAVEAVGEIISEHHLVRDNIAKISCRVPHLVARSLTHDAPSSLREAQFSMTFAAGCMLAFGELTLAQLTDDTLADDALKIAMAKIEMLEDDALSRSSAGSAGPECAHVVISTQDGATFERFNAAATGAPIKPMSDAALDDKFRDLAAHAGCGDRADRWLRRLRTIEDLDHIRALWQ